MTPIYITKNQDLITTVDNFITEWNSPTSSISVKTSGSTGAPKSIKIQKKFMISSAKMTGDFLDLRSGNTALLSMSPNTIGGIMMIVRSLVLDLQLVVIDASSSPLKDLDKHIDFAAMVPLQVKASLIHQESNLNRVDKLIIGGGPIDSKLEEQLKELNTSVYHTYGMTETISHIALRNVSKGDSSFKALDQVKLTSKDECLTISAPRIGVHDLQTNDIVQLLSETEFIWIGRSDFAINSGGIKIIPSIIESELGALIKDNFISIGIPDETLGQKHVLIIESDIEQTFTKDQFLKLEKFKQPKEIYTVSEFVRTESGKIDRNKTKGLILNAKKQVL